MTKKLISVEQACMGQGALYGKTKRKKPKKAVLGSYVDKLYPGQSCTRKIWHVTSDTSKDITLRPILLGFLGASTYFYNKKAAATFAKTLNAQLVSKAAKRIGVTWRVVPLTMTLTLTA
jgi:hypothetical protein